MKITWKGRARLLTFTDGEGEDAKRRELLVEPGKTYDVPKDATLAHEGTNWEKAKSSSSASSANKDKE